VFAQAYIPRTLDQVYDAERDVEKVLRGEGKGLIYADITGVANIHLGGGKKGDEEEGGEAAAAATAPGKVEGAPAREEGEEGLERSGDETAGSEDGSDDDEDGSSDDEDQERRPRGKKHEDKDDKKVRSSLFPLSLPLSLRSGSFADPVSLFLALAEAQAGD